MIRRKQISNKNKKSNNSIIARYLFKDDVRDGRTIDMLEINVSIFSKGLGDDIDTDNWDDREPDDVLIDMNESGPDIIREGEVAKQCYWSRPRDRLIFNEQNKTGKVTTASNVDVTDIETKLFLHNKTYFSPFSKHYKLFIQEIRSSIAGEWIPTRILKENRDRYPNGILNLLF